MNWMIKGMERGWWPDTWIRFGIRRLLNRRRKTITAPDTADEEAQFIESLRTGPVAVHTRAANEQHYELPARFFESVLGPHLKYSSAYWPSTIADLRAAEERMLALTCERAGIRANMEVLELGCGWGSLTLWMAEQFPGIRVTAVSNSHSQRAFITDRAKQKQLSNITVITADMNDFSTTETFDRVVSVEMFEHMRNYALLLERIASWLKPDGKLFLHIFCHRDHVYPFQTQQTYDWMGRYFFTGGLMPSETLLQRFNQHLHVENQWRVNGEHYARTLRAWLDNMDRHRVELRPLFHSVYGEQDGDRWFERWRVFFMACEELFAFRRGEEWFVTHLLMAKI